MLSRIAYIVSVLLLCYASIFYYPRWLKPTTEAAISWDVSGYYWYLPAAFIYKDIKHLGFKDAVINKYQPTNGELQQAMPLDNGNFVMKYSSGMAVMYLPFFTLAHMTAGALGYPADGFSRPYQFAIQFGGLLISLVGLWYLRKLLLLFYTDKVVAITLFLMACGTNYFNYAAIDCGMSHTWLFTIYVFLLLNTYHFYQSFRLKYAVRIGLLVGLATLTRPTEIISCLIPLLWGLEGIGLSSIRKQLGIVVAHYQKLLVAVVLAACVISIQLIYWKYVSGHWLVYSYGDQGFFWTRPYISQYSFNYRTGWLTYAPLMILAILGIIPFVKSGKNRLAIVCFLVLNYYIVSAWDIWWYGGRAMVQSYAVFSFPMAALVNAAISRRVLLWIGSLVVAVCMYFNFWMFIQYHGGGLYDGDSMTKQYFWRVLGKWSAPGQTKTLLDAPDLYEGEPADIRVIFENNFDTCTGPQHVPGPNGKAILLDAACVETPYYNIPYVKGKYRWIRARATVRFYEKEWDIWKMPKMLIRIKDNGTIIKDNTFRIGRIIEAGETKDIYMDLRLPDQHFTTVTFVIWNNLSDKKILVDNIRISEFND